MPKIIRREETTSNLGESISPILQRVYAARGVKHTYEVDYQLKYLAKPSLLKGVPEAVAILVKALTLQHKVLIVGDFDADGATSCTLAILALRAMGLQYIDFLVPNRFEYGYGLTPEIVDVAHQSNPDLIITVDNGIASISGVARANQLGISVIVTDHHLQGDVLPDAAAIINPNQQGCEFPSKNLAGVGVIFYLLSALRAELRAQNWFQQHNISEPNMAEYLDLVALGTVADVVPLDHNNRTLVYQGIQRVRAGKARPGILALLAVAGKDYRRLSSQDFGFIVGPRLNAAGRLDDISIGIQCLLTEDHDVARELASELDGLNRDRRAIESSMQKEAVSMLDSLTLNKQELPWGLCLYEENWHQGVVGILASRVKEKVHRPVIAFAKADDGTLKGSARSINGLHIRDVLDEIATQQPEVIQKFGGHAMAAGLSLELKQFENFKVLFDEVVRKKLREDQLQEVYLSDGELAVEYLNLHHAQLIQSAGPWGQGFPEPLFDGDFIVINQRLVGEKHLKLTLALPDNSQLLIDGIAFNIDLSIWPNKEVERVKLVYQLTVNEFRGQETVQFLVAYIEPISSQ